jgi:spore germination protein
LNEEGYPVIAALAPKTSRDQRGIAYEGHDYALIGASANEVFVMTYEWGYTYGPPLAVAPLASVRRGLDFAVSEIPAEKIFMGLPNYGYDWTLPYKPGESRARSIGNEEALSIARQFGAEIQFDESSATPFFYYNDNGVQHEVWFEDVRSLQQKFDLIKEFGLRGAGYWQIMQLFRANWLLLQDNFIIR